MVALKAPPGETLFGRIAAETSWAGSAATDAGVGVGTGDVDDAIAVGVEVAGEGVADSAVGWTITVDVGKGAGVEVARTVLGVAVGEGATVTALVPPQPARPISARYATGTRKERMMRNLPEKLG